MSFDLDITVTLVPDRPRPGEARTVTRKVYARYGLAKSRVIQEICDVVGGLCVYFQMCDGSVIPVPTWTEVPFVGSASGVGMLAPLAEYLDKVTRTSKNPVKVFGTDRRVWTLLPFRNTDGGTEERTAESDKDEPVDNPAAAADTAGQCGMREDF